MDARCRHGLSVSALDDASRHLAAQTLALHESIAPGATPVRVRLAVKSGATRKPRTLGAAWPPGTPVVSVQSGLSNAQVGQRAAPAWRRST